MKSYKARGVVLHTVKYGDSGVVAYLYTDRSGRQTYLVQGVRSQRSKGNKAALFQPLFVLEYEGIEPKHGEMHRMKDVVAAVPLSSIPFDARKSAIALFMAETLYRLVRESEANPHLFSFIEQTVHALDVLEEGVANFHLWFLVKLSYFLGFYPGNSYSAGDYFDIVRGEFVPLPPTHRIAMQREEAELLGRLMEVPIEQLGGIGLNRRQRVDFLNALLAFIGYHADTIRAVRSIDILKEVF
jgi:DNA repair protein RecO (recombination protein O)